MIEEVGVMKQITKIVQVDVRIAGRIVFAAVITLMSVFVSRLDANIHYRSGLRNIVRIELDNKHSVFVDHFSKNPESFRSSFEIVLSGEHSSMIMIQADSVMIDTAVISTSFGTIYVHLLNNYAPRTVKNFTELATHGYYDSVSFHRVAKGFVIQGGDPTGTGSGGESIYGRPFEDEIDIRSNLYTNGYPRGTVAMANRGPNTNTSQFFIVLTDTYLPPNYTIFGRVVKGMDVVDKIGAVEIIPKMGPNDGTPKEPVIMTSIRVR